MQTSAHMHWLKRLFGHRLIFVMGKGGVGKTTVSILLAMSAARLGKKVLLAELGDSDAIGRLFHKIPLPETPLALSENIWGARVNAKAELEEYVHTHVNPGFIANRITQSRLFDYLFAATPGLKEVMSLGRIWRWEKSKAEGSDPLFDLIIVDSPATGHALSLLQLPMQLISMIRVGPIVSQIQYLQKLLQDRGKTCLSLVTLPEELPANEAVEFSVAAQSTLDIPVEVVFINSVWPASYSAEEATAIESLTDPSRNNELDESVQVLLMAAMKHIRRRTIQEKYIDQIKSNIAAEMVEVPFYFTNNLSLEDIRQISLSVISSMKQTDQGHD